MTGIGCSESKTQKTNSQNIAAPPDTTATQTTTQVDTKTYEDQQWLNAVTMDTRYSGDLVTDLINLDNAKITDEKSANLKRESAEKVYKSTQAALKNSNNYVVSPDLQPAKEEYNQGLIEMNTVAVLFTRAIDSSKAGHTFNFDSKSIQDLIDSSGKHFKNASSLMSDYKAKNGIEEVEFSSQETNDQTQSTPSTTQETTVNQPVTQVETKKYDDLLWSSAIVTDITSIMNDITNVINACNNIENTESLSKYTTDLYLSSDAALKHSNSYIVSPDLQPAKDEYNKALAKTNSAAVFLHGGIESYKKGDIENFNKAFTFATEDIDSAGLHLDKGNALLAEYKKKKGIA